MDVRSQQRLQPQPRQESPVTMSPPTQESSNRRSYNKGPRDMKKILLLGVVPFLVVCALITALWMMSPSAMGTVKRDKYQAVFLTN